MKTSAKIPANSNVAHGRFRYPSILLRQMVITDFKLRYQGSVLGYLWSLLKPMALFAILYVVFVNFLGVGSDVPNFPIYLLLGIVIWTFFVEVTSQGIVAIVDKGDLLRKLNFPRYVVVLSAAFSALINLALNLIVIGVFIIFSHVEFHSEIILAPLLILELFSFSVAAAFFLSALFVRFRDLSYIWELFLQAAFYATPIIYPITIHGGGNRLTGVPLEYGKWLLLNPLAQIIQDLRYVLVTDHAATIGVAWHTPWIRVVPIGFTIVLGIGAAIYFRSKSRYFAEDV